MAAVFAEPCGGRDNLRPQCADLHRAVQSCREQAHLADGHPGGESAAKLRTELHRAMRALRRQRQKAARERLMATLEQCDGSSNVIHEARHASGDLYADRDRHRDSLLQVKSLVDSTSGGRAEATWHNDRDCSSVVRAEHSVVGKPIMVDTEVQTVRVRRRLYGSLAEKAEAKEKRRAAHASAVEQNMQRRSFSRPQGGVFTVKKNTCEFRALSELTPSRSEQQNQRHVCEVCGAVHSSRNALFRHLRSSCDPTLGAVAAAASDAEAVAAGDMVRLACPPGAVPPGMSNGLVVEVKKVHWLNRRGEGTCAGVVHPTLGYAKVPLKYLRLKECNPRRDLVGRVALPAGGGVAHA